MTKLTIECAKAILKYDADIDESIIDYVTSIFQDLVDEECWELDEWVAGVSPILGDYIDEEEDISSICKNVIQALPSSSDEKVSKDKKKQAKQPSPPKNSSALITIQPLTMGYMGSRALLERTELVLEKGRRYGLVGDNGAGKTTLMRRIAARNLPGFPEGVRTAFVEHEIPISEEMKNVTSYLQNAAIQEGLHLDVSAIRGHLTAVGFTTDMLRSKIKELSGGWKMKLAIARAMLFSADLLCLDEPTTHLDVKAVAWLEEYLCSLKITVVVVSHEPPFLDKVVTDVIYLHKQKLRTFRGNFTDFVSANPSFNIEDFVAKPKEKLYLKFTNTGLRFIFPNPGKLLSMTHSSKEVSPSRTVLKMDEVNFSYKAGIPILKNVSIRLTLSSRVGVWGGNGAGKSTMVRLAAGDLFFNDISTGKFWKHCNMRVAYVAQHAFHHLEKHLNATPMQYIMDRFKHGIDKEGASLKEGKYKKNQRSHGLQPEAILGRRRGKNTIKYEVKWKDLGDQWNSWVVREELQKYGTDVMKLVKMVDAKFTGRAAGLDKRPRTIKEISRHLADFGLNKRLSSNKISGLSGGQRSRLVLAASMWAKPHMIILDEPTNYLDQEALGALVQAITHFKGGIIIVSHHDQFLRSVCKEIWHLKNGELTTEKIIKKKKKTSDYLI